jgi:SNF2 family DNA or RNA helicase
MICVDTIDERIDSIVIKKGATADLLVDGKVAKLTKHDILQLIG